MKTIKGDLLTLADQGEFDVIVHGCNTKGVMGAGIAKSIAQAYPQALIADRGSLYFPNRLGQFTTAEAKNQLGGKLLIINAYTQEDYRRRKGEIQANYKAIEQVFESIAKHFKTSRIGYPKIGAGLAGGDWSIISKIIDQKLAGLDHTLVLL